MRITFLLISLCIIHITAAAQHVFSSKLLDGKNVFLPYDFPYAQAVEDKEFILLQETGDFQMLLGRYNQYMFERWEVPLRFSPAESVPQLFVMGDSVVLFQITFLPQEQKSKVLFLFFDSRKGTELGQTEYLIPRSMTGSMKTTVDFSGDRSKFVVTGVRPESGPDTDSSIRVFSVGDKTPIASYSIPMENPALNGKVTWHLANNGDLFMVHVDPGNYRIHCKFWSIDTGEPVDLESGFYFDRPVNQVGQIHVVRQGVSSYFVSFDAFVDNELIGFHTSGINVILKAVMASADRTINQNEIQSAFSGFYVTDPGQKEKQLEIPKKMENYRLQQVLAADNSIVLFFEELEQHDLYHASATDRNYPWKGRLSRDKNYRGGDMLIYCYDANGGEKWAKVIQRSQKSSGTLGLSYLSRFQQDRLQLLTNESVGAGNVYFLDLDLVDGALVRKIALFQDKHGEMSKKYSCWLDQESVVVGSLSSSGSERCTLMLVEF